MGGGPLSIVNFNVMTKDTVCREKREDRKVITKICWGDRKEERSGSEFYPCIKIRGKEGEREIGRERDDINSLLTTLSTWGSCSPFSSGSAGESSLSDPSSQ